MKLFILTCAYNDCNNTLGIETPRIFKTREEANKVLQEKFEEYEDMLSQWMDSELNLDAGYADIYDEDDNHFLLEIEEIEVA